jgi:hypothetical protein
MFEIVASDGNLLLSRFSGEITEECMSHCIQAVRAVIAKNNDQGQQTVCVTDVREVEDLTPGAADVLVWLMRRNNAARTINAYFARTAPMPNVAQFEELVRQGQSDLRRTFAEETQLLTWIATFLGPQQKFSVRPFLRRTLAPVRTMVATRPVRPSTSMAAHTPGGPPSRRDK